jgi:hypothetical protein
MCFSVQVEIPSLPILQSIEIHEAFLKALVIDSEVVRTSVLYQFEQQGAVTLAAVRAFCPVLLQELH